MTDARGRFVSLSVRHRSTPPARARHHLFRFRPSGSCRTNVEHFNQPDRNSKVPETVSRSERNYQPKQLRPCIVVEQQCRQRGRPSKRPAGAIALPGNRFRSIPVTLAPQQPSFTSASPVSAWSWRDVKNSRPRDAQKRMPRRAEPRSSASARPRLGTRPFLKTNVDLAIVFFFTPKMPVSVPTNTTSCHTRR